jgi:hypothetical protein
MRTLEKIAISQEEFQALKARLPKATAEGITATYRISQNTWCKLREGRPVKRNVVELVRDRFREVCGQ